MWIGNETLEGQWTTLEPLEETHIEPLKKAVSEGESWKLWFASVPTPEAMPDYVNRAMQDAREGNIAYAVRLKSSGEIVGTTRYYHVDEANRRAMIGYTWYSDSVKRTPVNTECKYLLLSHLFEGANAIAVEFRTHFFNQTSRAAIERLGAKQDGILRHHQIMKDGSFRDTVVYSIIASEWPAVKANLLSKLRD
ncbi:GNAT family N-acetyltransferase [Photobacterium galatheae]|uniref:GCN5 family acetyltransferase n=1 Tax=Photobacterium galatheae TaxID=1654360 RepID=A0A066RRZ8_9GAMM|nr:GNAT family protein [Photobacterium galatheae]KDM93124.1 GCN5 family acetyltransferase [Photobacterium galatheae]MCM0148348.1 GNAT family N-acetyltransferase [Photobacterium galatheae]